MASNEEQNSENCLDSCLGLDILELVVLLMIANNSKSSHIHC